jgi:hypothetical protein
MADEIQNPAPVIHFEDETMMLAIDGELPSSEAERLQTHLTVCSDCSQRWMSLREASLACEMFQNESAAFLPAPPRNWEGFETQLRTALAEPVAQQMPWWQPAAESIRRVFSGPLLPWSLSGATAAVAIALLLWYVPAKQALSVNDVLSRSENESAASVADASPVIYQKFRITDSSTPQKAVTVQLWSDRKLGRFREVVADNSATSNVSGAASRTVAAKEDAQEQLVSDLHAAYDANHLSWNSPISAAAFRSWTQSSGQKQESMQEDHLADGEKVYQLTAQAAQPTAANSPFLRTMELLVRASDWHAVAQRMTVSTPVGDHTYEIAELEYRPLAPGQLPANLFGAQNSALAVASDLGSHTLPSEKPSQTDLAVEALERLDRTDALVKDQVVVIRTENGALEIRGIVRSEARAAEIVTSLGALASDPAVRLNLLSAGNAQSSGATSLSHPIQMQDVDVQLSQSATVAEVRNYLAASRHLPERDLDQAADRFVTDAVEHSTVAQLNAQALKNIVSVAAWQPSGFISPQTQERWRLLVVRHSQASLHEVQSLEQQLAPVFAHANPAEGSLPAEPEAKESLPAVANLLLNRTTDTDRMLWQAFSSNTSAADRNGLTDARFWTMLKEECTLATQLTEKVHP